MPDAVSYGNALDSRWCRTFCRDKSNEKFLPPPPPYWHVRRSEPPRAPSLLPHNSFTVHPPPSLLLSPVKANKAGALHACVRHASSVPSSTPNGTSFCPLTSRFISACAHTLPGTHACTHAQTAATYRLYVVVSPDTASNARVGYGLQDQVNSRVRYTPNAAPQSFFVWGFVCILLLAH